MRAWSLLAALTLLLPAAAALVPPLPAPLPAVPPMVGPNRALPIVVLGDGGFALPPDVSGVRGGAGTAADPYRVEGWSIASLPFNPTLGDTGYGNVWLPCILLQNTAAHVVIRDNHVRGNNCHGIWLQNASHVLVERNLVEYNTGHGLLAETFGPPSLGHLGCCLTVRDNVFKGNGFDGLRLFPAAGAWVEGNQFVANADHGLLARGVEGLVARGNLADYNAEAGFLVQLSPGARVEGNVLRHHPRGLELGAGDGVEVRGNAATDNGDGIVVGHDATGASLDGNLLRGNARGVVLEACAAVRHNGFHANALGLRSEAACSGLLGNNLAGNAVGASSAAALDMPGNWWGSPTGPAPFGTGDAVSGPIAVHPWLAAPHPDAPS